MQGDIELDLDTQLFGYLITASAVFFFLQFFTIRHSFVFLTRFVHKQHRRSLLEPYSAHIWLTQSHRQTYTHRWLILTPKGPYRACNGTKHACFWTKGETRQNQGNGANSTQRPSVGPWVKPNSANHSASVTSPYKGKHGELDVYPLAASTCSTDTFLVRVMYNSVLWGHGRRYCWLCIDPE